MSPIPRSLAVLAAGALTVSLTAVASPSIAASTSANDHRVAGAQSRSTVDHAHLPALHGVPVSSSHFSSLASPSAPSARAAAKRPHHGKPKPHKTYWPVGFRTATFGASDRPVDSAAPTPAQSLVGATFLQARAASVIQAVVRFGAAPTADTDAHVTLAFGKVVTEGTSKTCQGVGFTFDTFDPGNGATRDGAVLSLAGKYDKARTAAWNCSFARMYSTDDATYYDSLIGSLKDHIQKAILGFKVDGAKINNRRFTKVKVKIANSDQTIATARNVTLSWKTKKVAIHAKRNVGSIAPGKSKIRFIYVKSTKRGKGLIKLIAHSGDYRHSITLHVKPTRR